MDAISLIGAAEALSFVDPTETRTWVRMAFALYDEFGDAAWDTWDRWSQGAANYNEKAAKWRWASLKRRADRGGEQRAGIATLIWEAKRGGWKMQDEHRLKLSREESARLAAEREARRTEQLRQQEEDYAKAAALAQAIWDGAECAQPTHAYLQRKRVGVHGLRHVPEWVLESVDSETGEVRVIRIPDALLVPMWSSPGKLASLQAIFANKKNPIKADKSFLKNGRARECYAIVGAITAETMRVIVCEGYATAATLHEATGWPVMVAFMASNLGPISKLVRARLPQATVIVAGDNDQWDRDGHAKPIEKNTGVQYATEAAKEVSGVLAIPQFANTESKPTDFNDLALLEGLAMVRAQIDVAVDPPAPPALPPTEGATEPSTPPPPPVGANILGHDPSDHFKVLGYDHGDYFFMSAESRQVIVCTKRDFTEVGLLELAPLDWWEMEFPAKQGFDKKMASDWLIRACRQAGIYDNTRIRGRGAWLDDGRVVYHHGEKLSVDGTYTAFDQLKSRYVYEMDRALPEPHEEPMTADVGEWLLGLAEMFRWTQPGSAALLAGWCALAPICGALKWRPHLWITGGAGSGKSTILNDFVHYLMAGVDIYAQGSSSEAGIRQTLRTDALPVLFDESESREKLDAMRIQNILNLIRQASTESQARTLKGTAFGDPMSFHIRSMFCLASIQVAINNQADIDRLSVLNLRPPREDEDPAGTWEKIKARLTKLKREADLPARLLRRSINLLSVTQQSIAVFCNAFAEQCGSVRDGDQYGTLLAGCWSLLSDRVPTKEDALELINRYDWSEHREDHDIDDSQRAYSYLLEARIRVNGGVEATVNELVRAAAGKANGIDLGGAVVADAMLQRYGMRLTDGNDQLLVSNDSMALRGLLAHTPFAADIRGMLLRVPGASKYGNKSVRFNGTVTKCLALPTDTVLADE